jgi:hypothetical protein
MHNFSQMVSAAAEAAKKTAQQNAIAGICEPLRLYYKTGELRLEVKWNAPEGFEDSGKALPMSLPYSAYWQWIERESGRLPIL